jgi:hypothetical protein
VLVELHHDGTVVTAVDVSHNALPPRHPEVPLPVSSPVLISAVFETIALIDEHRLALRADSPVELRAVLQTQPGSEFRFAPVVLDHRRPEVAEWARQPRSVQPAHSDLAPFADDQALTAGATDLAEGLLHQFGLDILPTCIRAARAVSRPYQRDLAFTLHDLRARGSADLQCRPQRGPALSRLPSEGDPGETRRRERAQGRQGHGRGRTRTARALPRQRDAVAVPLHNM